MNPVKLAVIGAGRMGQLYARIATELPQTDLVAVCGQRAERVGELARRLEVPGYSGGAYARLLAEHPDLDAAIVATPEWLHLDPALAALEAGKHLLLEKPIATHVGDAERIVAAAQSRGLTLMICHQLRFDPRYVLAKEALNRGDIGQLAHVYARRHTTAVAASRVQGQIPLTCWISPHELDVLLWLTGSRVTAVSSHTRGAAGEADGYFQAVLRFASGVSAVFEQSWVAPALVGRTRQVMLDLRGTAGAIEGTPNEQGLAIFGEGAPSYPALIESPVIHGRVFGVFPALVAHFAECVSTSCPPLIGGRDGLAAVRVADAIGRALEAHREVTLD